MDVDVLGAAQWVAESFGWPLPRVNKWRTTGGIPQSQLKAKIAAYIDAGLPEDGVGRQRVATLWLAYLLSSTLMIEKSKDRIRVPLIYMCRDPAATGGYAWGAAALAYQYRAMGKGTRRRAKGMDGCPLLLQEMDMIIVTRQVSLQ